MRSRLLILVCVTVAALPVAFVAGSQLVPKTETVTKPVVVRPAADWSPERIGRVFENVTPYGAQNDGGVSCTLYGSSKQPPDWAVQVCVQVAAGPAG